MKKNKSAKIIFGDALGNGMKTAMINGITGGMTGGIIGGIQGMRTGVQYKRTFSKLQNDLGGHLSTMEAYQLKMNDPQCFLEKFSDTYYSDYIYKENAELVYNKNYTSDNAVTTASIRRVKYKVTFGPSSFKTNAELYFTMGHEYIHVAHGMNGLDSKAFSEYTAYMWEKRQMRTAFMREDYINDAQEMAKQYLNVRYSSQSQLFKLNLYQVQPTWGLPNSVPYVR